MLILSTIWKPNLFKKLTKLSLFILSEIAKDSTLTPKNIEKEKTPLPFSLFTSNLWSKAEPSTAALDTSFANCPQTPSNN
jgi:hypothetical protein